MFFWNSCFFHDPVDVGNLISGSSAFSKTSLNIWKFTAHVLLKPGLENFKHYFTSVWDECNCEVVWAFFGIALGFPGGSEVKVSACNAGNLGWIPGSGRSPGEGNGNPLQYSCLENPMGGGARWATVHWVTKSWTRLSDFTFTFFGIGMKTDLSGYYNWLLVAGQPTATSLTCAVA